MLILVVESESRHAQRAGDGLGSDGWTVEVAPSCAAAAAAATKHPPDLVLVNSTLAGARDLLRDFARKNGGPGAIALLPEILLTGFRVEPIPFIGDELDAIMPSFITQGLNVQFYFGGTSLLIVVGVAMDTVNQVESQLIMRHYDGFMKKTRIRSRRG